MNHDKLTSQQKGEPPPPQFRKIDQPVLLVTNFGAPFNAHESEEEREQSEYYFIGHQKSQSRPSSATADAGVTASPSVHFIDEVLEGSEPQSDENQQPERARLFNVASGGGGLQRGSKQSREDGIRSNNDEEPLMSQQQGNLRPSDMELYAEDRAQIRITRTTDADARQEQAFPIQTKMEEFKSSSSQNIAPQDYKKQLPPVPPKGTSSSPTVVDYSSANFQRSRALIAEAAERASQRSQQQQQQQNQRNDGPSSPSDVLTQSTDGKNVRVKKIGDTTIITEHRDPYSFYWQLDTMRKLEEEPRKRLPPVEQVIDEVIEEDEEEEIEEFEEEEEEFYHLPLPAVVSPDSNDSGVHEGSHYAQPHRPLPSVIDKHEDPSRFSNYWHVDSGKRPPTPPLPPKQPISPPVIIVEPPPMLEVGEFSQQTEPMPSEPVQPVIEERSFKQTVVKRCVELNDEQHDETIAHYSKKLPYRFGVRSLGSMELSANNLSASRSQQSIGRIIEILSSSAIGASGAKWGDGRDLILELDDNELRLLDQDSNMKLLNREKIANIRAWSIDHNRHFAYVTQEGKNGSTRYLCHAFRCDTPAKNIANSLESIIALADKGASQRKQLMREHLPPLPLTPVNEPKRIIRCHFIGVTHVQRATGIEVLNEAVDRLLREVDRRRWILCDVHISPSTISLNEASSGMMVAQCRVRYLSFLGIGRDVKHCAFIVQASAETFVCYVLYLEPSAGPLAKTIEGACKLRYQRVIDAQLTNPVGGESAFRNGRKYSFNTAISSP